MRHPLASRRGLVGLAMLAVFAMLAWLVAPHLSAVGNWAVIPVAIMAIGIPFSHFALNVWHGELSNGDSTGELKYEGEARVAFRRTAKRPGYTLVGTAGSGFRPVEVRGGDIRIGTSDGTVRFVAVALGVTHRLTASQYEVECKWLSRISTARPAAWCVVLQGHSRRGRFLEYTLVPRDGETRRLFEAVEKAGARPGQLDDTRYLASAAPKPSRA